jgi:hypothetical protein
MKNRAVFLILIFLSLTSCKDNTELNSKFQNLENKLVILDSKLKSLEVELNKLEEQKTTDIPKFKKANDLIKYLYQKQYDYNTLAYESVFWKENRNEILKTFEIVDMEKYDRFCVSFVRYSVKAKVYRETIWLISIDDYWYYINYMSSYVCHKYNNSKEFKNWVKQKEGKISKWEENSATIYF